MRKYRLAAATLSLFLMLLLIPPVSAQRYVRLLIVGDEEYRAQAESFFGHYMNWKTLADFQMTLAQVMFSTRYGVGISLVLSGYVEWKSDWGPNYVTLMNESIQDTGFQSGYLYDIMVVFTGEDISVAGAAWTIKSVVIIKDTFGYMWSGYDAYVDNFIVHEISHLYGTPNHYAGEEGYTYCVMSLGDASLTSEQWCSSCLNTIKANREKYGYVSGGGGGGRCFPIGGVEGS